MNGRVTEKNKLQMEKNIERKTFFKQFFKNGAWLRG